MISKYIVKVILEHEIRCINEELSVCIDYICKGPKNTNKDAQITADRLAFAAEILERILLEINKL